MPTLSDAEQRFVRARRWRARAWPWVGIVLTAAWAGLLAWLWSTQPTLVDPRLVWSGLTDGSLQEPSVHLLAAMTPVLVCTVFVVVLATLLLAFGCNAHERRMLRLLERLEEGSTSG